METNERQLQAVRMRKHCVVLAGPGSGKTKTLVTAIARCLIEDVQEPRGVVCITYSNECVLELESRLQKFGLLRRPNLVVATVHSFALGQILLPFSRCFGLLPQPFAVATKEQVLDLKQIAFSTTKESRAYVPAWRDAERLRRKYADRASAAWNAETASTRRLRLAYEDELARHGLVDFESIVLLAVTMLRRARWLRQGLRAKFPVIFVDEYQDLGVSLIALNVLAGAVYLTRGF